MKDVLRALVAGRPPAEGVHLTREYLQARLLACLQRGGAMVPLAFQGGTALRFLYNLPRFSEDLDFALVEGRGADYDLRRVLESAKHELRHDDLPAEITLNDKATVHKAHVRFRGLLHGLGLSPHADRTLMIRVEVDTHPPAAAGIETTIVRRHELLHLQHHDKASLLAGKLHAILARPYAKGRDYYDLVWYLGDRTWPEPNITLLKNALAQTGWREEPLTSTTWREAVLSKAQAADWRAVTADVAPFLERAADVALVNRAMVEKVLERSPPTA